MDHPFENNGTGMRISREVLEDVCKKMIRMILFCLPDAFRGTIYSVGPVPDLRTVRIATGRREGATDEIVWGALNPSDYDPPGKAWDTYRDRPGGILEAMAWCVERQKSWTAEDPAHNIRCVRKQLEGRAPEDYHHMEPVLVKKTDLWETIPSLGTFPEDSSGQTIWKDSPYATVAVIKIHFLPGTIKQGDKSTRIIKELSRSLGTEMLSLHAKEISLEKEKSLMQERQETCNTFAHEFRNLLARMGVAYRIANNEVAYLRQLWEDFVHERLPDLPSKKDILQKLNNILEHVAKECAIELNSEYISRLIQHQEQLAKRCLLPHQNEIWLKQRIEPLWVLVMSEVDLDPLVRKEVESLLARLKQSFSLVTDSQIIEKIDTVDDEIKRKWVELAYREINGKDNGDIQPYIKLLDKFPLEIPHKKQSMSNFIYLKGLLEMIPEIERTLNSRLDELKNSGS